MLYLRQTKPERIREWLDDQSSQAITHAHLCGTHDESMPVRFHHIDFQNVLGRGQNVYETAVLAMQQWNSFHLPWTQTIFDGTPQVGHQLAVVAKVLGTWSVNCCRVVATNPGHIDERTGDQTWSFTIGTLPRHMAIGEEQISVTLQHETGDVIYGIRSFSRPGNLLIKIATPIVRRQQARFCDESAKSMRRFIRANDRVPATEDRVFSV